VNLDWIIPCRYAEVHDNLATLVGAGIDTWWLPVFPAAIQVVVAVRLLASAEELGPDQDHTNRNVISDPSGAVISDLEHTFQIGTREQADAARKEWLNGIELVTIIQFEATGPGSYSFEHIVDGSSKTVPLHVLEGPPPGFVPDVAE
jgi:hypothetical protein